MRLIQLFIPHYLASFFGQMKLIQNIRHNIIFRPMDTISKQSTKIKNAFFDSNNFTAGELPEGMDESGLEIVRRIAHVVANPIATQAGH